MTAWMKTATKGVPEGVATSPKGAFLPFFRRGIDCHRVGGIRMMSLI